jgi:hypothetical protein
VTAAPRRLANSFSSALAALVGFVMNSIMRVPILLLAVSMAAQSLPAAPLTSADREALLDSLDKLKEAAEGKMDSRVRAALSAFTSASGSDAAAMDLYLNCLERVNFDDQKKKNSEFREWKRTQSDKLSEPSLKTALRYQLRWLVLALRSVSENADRKKIAAEGQQIVDAIFSSPDRLKGQREVLSESAMSSVFARAYEVNQFKVSDFPLSPLPIGQVYDDLVLPSLRSPTTLVALQSAWQKRIQQETILVEGFDGGRGSAVGIKSTPVSTTSSAAYENFMADTKPRLQWMMELDLFKNGDQSGAAVRLLTLLQKNISHPSARDWSEELKSLLTPEESIEVEDDNETAP